MKKFEIKNCIQFNIYRETAKILALSTTKIGKHGYLTGEEISPSGAS